MLVPMSRVGDRPHLMHADGYPDGTVWFFFRGEEDIFALVCIDGRPGSPTRHRMFDQAGHSRKPGAVLLELGCPEEGVIVPAVSRWLDSAEPRKQGLSDYGWELIRDSLLRLGDPILPEDSRTSAVHDRCPLGQRPWNLGSAILKGGACVSPHLITEDER